MIKAHVIVDIVDSLKPLSLHSCKINATKTGVILLLTCQQRDNCRQHGCTRRDLGVDSKHLPGEMSSMVKGQM